MDQTIQQTYSRWLQRAEDKSIRAQLLAMQGDEAAVEDAFFRELAFGTGGLRGVLGAGTNRMNLYTVGKASQGLARYVVDHFPPAQRRIAIAYDSRRCSDLFARTAAGVFAANGLTVFLYKELMPTPCLSFAVRDLGCAAGVVVTASHNPAAYNGYKVYGSDGCQITTEAADAILACIQQTDVFDGVCRMDFEHGVQLGMISYIPDEVLDRFLAAVRRCSVAPPDLRRDLSIVYTPLNGTGRVPVTRVLRESGFTNVSLVKEQEMPDGSFPTCPYPNPEVREALALGLRDADARQADLLLATDPDCDRVGIAVRDEQGAMRLLTGNQVGVLLLDYICRQRLAQHTMPADPVMIKTIVTTDMAQRVAEHYGVRTLHVLTGFKYIGEQIGLLEKQGKADSYLFGFEESYGYLSGTHVRDKDAVNASLMICEMYAFYKQAGLTLTQRLDELYRTYGFYLDTLHSYQFAGSAGMQQMARIMQALRGGVDTLGGLPVAETLDYLPGRNGLPSSDVLQFLLAGGGWVVVRPSGTEPKLKVYVSVCADGPDKAAAVTAAVEADMRRLLGV
ncbi:MAG: phospho-sugar mutase [Clostridia bacterium]|nr:phospho-sugar mutase [Clostridia bacterium]